jgi:hypothetical protein
LIRPPLVDEREVRALVAEVLRHALGHLDPACVRRHDGELLARVPLDDVLAQGWHGHQVVHRAVEEALDLRRVQVDADEPVGTGRLEHVREQPGADRLAAAVLLVLTGVPVERQHDRDPLGGGALERVHHEHLLHDPLVDGLGVALDDEGVATAYGLLEPHVDLAVGEVVGRGGHQSDAQPVDHLLGEGLVRTTREDHEVLLRGPLHSGHA